MIKVKKDHILHKRRMAIPNFLSVVKYEKNYNKIYKSWKIWMAHHLIFSWNQNLKWLSTALCSQT